MSETNHLVFAILKFLEEQRQSLSEESAESLEVAQQCLETAYGVSLGDADSYPLPASLTEIFTASVQNAKSPLDPELKDAAEKAKQEGNDHMRQEKHAEALACYTKAVEIDGNNAVYFCNRAAAYSKLNQHEEALQDCIKALKLDPGYSKAYGRKGLAHSALNQHQDAKECYQRALQLDPENKSYQQNLDIAEQKIQDSQKAEQPGASLLEDGAPSLGGLNMSGLDFSSLLNNPALMSMATNMLQNPEMQQMMANMMAGGGGGGGQGAAGMPPENMGGLLQAGQQLAQQMQQNNPELVNQLREQMRQPPPGRLSKSRPLEVPRRPSDNDSDGSQGQ